MIREQGVSTLLTTIPKSWISWDFEIRDGDTLLGTLSIPWFAGERGTLTIGGPTAIFSSRIH